MSGLPVRVMVQDAWDQVALDLPAGSSISELKRRALDLTHSGRGRPEDYLVKFRGAELLDESRSLSDEGVVPNAALIVMPRFRRPVR